MLQLRDTLKDFTSYYSKCVKTEVRLEAPTRTDTLRISGLAYCGLKHVYTRMIQPAEYLSFGSEYYTGVGTLTHEAVQDFLGRGGRMYGVWDCEQDGCHGQRTFSANNRCPACNSEMKYNEISIDLSAIFPNVSSCHLDGVFKDSKGKYWLVDYKTTNSRTAKQPLETTTLPYPTNKAQIMAYCAVLEWRFNINVEGWILFYIARDQPINTHRAVGNRITVEEKKTIMAKLATASTHYGMVMNATSFDTVTSLVEQKPCKTVEIYEKEYATFGGCPLHHICFENKMLQKELSRAWEDKEPDFLEWRRPDGLPILKL